MSILLNNRSNNLNFDVHPTENRMTNFKEMPEDEVTSLEDARKLVRDLRQRTRAQAQQILAWKRAYRMQESVVSRIRQEKCDQLKTLSSKLLLFESRLLRKQKDISSMLTLRENIIHKQQKLIETLLQRLTDNGLEISQSELTDMEFTLPDLDSLNDSDSAVVLEDIDSDSNIVQIPRFRSGSSDGITVVRSISDAIDPNFKYCQSRRNSSYLRRPEILETVYSVEEDGDNENQSAENNEANKKRSSFANKSKEITNQNKDDDETNYQNDKDSEEKEYISNRYEKENDSDSSESHQSNKQGNPVKTYNRVMSNHRSVTKPKDVKYKRINKAKSKSLEELRGRLKNWVEQGTKLAGLSLEHRQSYA